VASANIVDRIERQLEKILEDPFLGGAPFDVRELKRRLLNALREVDTPYVPDQWYVRLPAALARHDAEVRAWVDALWRSLAFGVDQARWTPGARPAIHVAYDEGLAQGQMLVGHEFGGRQEEDGPNPLAPFPAGEGGTRHPGAVVGTPYSPPRVGEGPGVRSLGTAPADPTANVALGPYPLAGRKRGGLRRRLLMGLAQLLLVALLTGAIGVLVGQMLRTSDTAPWRAAWPTWPVLHFVQQAYVAHTDLYVRSAPAANASVVGIVPGGTRLSAVEQSVVRGEPVDGDDRWVDVTPLAGYLSGQRRYLWLGGLQPE